MLSRPSTIWVKWSCTQARKRVPVRRMTLITTLAGSLRINQSRYTLMGRQMIMLISERSGSTFRWSEICQRTMSRRHPWTTSWKKMKYTLLQPTLGSPSFQCSREITTMWRTMMSYHQFRFLPTWPWMNCPHCLQNTVSTIRRCTMNLRDGRYSEGFLWWCTMIKQCSTSSKVSDRVP